MVDAATDLTPAQLAAAIDAAMAAAPIKPPRMSAGYAVAVVVVGGIAAALPFIYLALPLAFLGAAAVIVVGVIPHISGPYGGFFVAGVVVGFVAAALSLIAPLFRRRRKPDEKPIVVTRASEPVFFHLLEACARSLDTRVPAEVHFTCEANAAVTLGDRCVLVVGLPLVAVLSVRELAGVLCHELGHVRQSWARRFIVGVAGVIGWFSGVLDAAREPGDGDGGTVEVVRRLSLFFGVLVLSVVLRVANVLVLALSREMELDADRCEATVAGSAAFAATTEKICAAAVVVDGALLRAVHRRDPLADNLPRFAAAHVERMPAHERRRAARVLTRDAAGIPHPPYDARVKNARAVDAKGCALPDAQATALFRNFDSYALRATRDLVFALPGVRLVATAELLAAPPPR